jgi:hypothetical protein
MVYISLVPMLNLLYFYISTLRSMCAVPSMAVLCSSLISFFSNTLLRYFEMDTLARVVIDIIFVFTHALCFCCKVFIFYSFLRFFITYLS